MPLLIAAAIGRFVLELGRFVLMQVAVTVVLSALSRRWNIQPATEGI